MKDVFLVLFIIWQAQLFAQPTFDRQDTLRGSVTPERIWWDLHYYHLDIRVDPAEQTISGSNRIAYTILEPSGIMQIDLQPPMVITTVEQDGETLEFTRDGNAYFVKLIKPQLTGAQEEVLVSYEGRPVVSRRPPWDGGLTWRTDAHGNPFVATSCQGEGASLWWPCKDHMYDEPDSMLISVNVPEGLMDVSNGRLRGVEDHPDRTRTFHWFVSNPISNYVVNVNIADYVHFSEKYQGEKGELDMDYYVLPDHLPQAKEQFKDAVRTLEAFEHWFGPYPFYEDGYKLVEVPYLGMEHQSSVTYGNQFKNGYLGMDLSETGWGLKFDFIIVHESGHEWFANNITYQDIADMWVHEGFTAYSENLFLDYHYGTEAGAAYTRGTRLRISNDRPIIGYYDVNHAGSSDMYYKGANLLHMLRQVVDDDEKWRNILRGLNQEFYHQTVTSNQIERYISSHAGADLGPVFDQYLRDVRIPVLEYGLHEGFLRHRWGNCVEGFNLPVRIFLNGKPHWLKPTPHWSRIQIDSDVTALRVDPDFYVASFNVLGAP